MELFRREALDGQDRLHGDIVFVPQISWRLLGGFFAAALALAILFLLTADYRPATPAVGRLAAHGRTFVAEIPVSAAAADAIAEGQDLRLSAPGVAGMLDARVTELRPARDGTMIVLAQLDSAAAPRLRAGMAVRTAVPGRARPLAAWLYDRVSGSGRA